MKISFSTLGCPAWSLDRILDAAGRLGYDGVELRFVEETTRSGRAASSRRAASARRSRRLRDAALASRASTRGRSSTTRRARRATALSTRRRARWSWPRGWVRRASASSAIACSRDRRPRRHAALVAESLARLAELRAAARRRGVARVARRLRPRGGHRVDRGSCRLRRAWGSSGIPRTRSSRARRRTKGRASWDRASATCT